MPKFFVTPQDIVGKKITLTGENEKHIKTVLRAREGEEITVCDGEGMDYQCRILSLERGVVTEVLSSAPCDVEPETKITLYQGLPKADKMEWIIQKAVELGVYQVIPVATKNTVVKLDAKREKAKLERWQAIAESAAKQSGRGRIPQVGKILGFQEALQWAASLDRAWIPYEKEEGMEATRRELAALSGEVTSVGIFIGPEGGFDEEEIRQAREAGIQPISLGKRILRTETAGLAILSLLMMKAEGAF